MTTSPLLTKTADVVREDILRVIRNRRPAAPLSADDDEVIRANAVSVAIEGAYVHQQWVLRQYFAQTADWDYLILLAQQLAGMTPKRATLASGTVTATGTVGAVIPAGAQLTHNGETWTVTEDVVISGDGTAALLVVATNAGSIGNLSPSSNLSFISAPAGVVSNATVIAVGGGADNESLEELRSRLLFAIANPEGTGTVADLKRWALEVEGVTGAYVYPRRRGLGTADICIVSAGSLPSPELCQAVSDHIESKAPAQGDRVVFAPDVVVVDFIIKVAISNTTALIDVTARIDAALTAFFDAFEPGGSLIRAQVEALIMSLDGVVDVNLVEPSANVTASVSEALVQWLRKGTVSVEVM